MIRNYQSICHQDKDSSWGHRSTGPSPSSLSSVCCSHITSCLTYICFCPGWSMPRAPCSAQHSRAQHPTQHCGPFEHQKQRDSIPAFPLCMVMGDVGVQLTCALLHPQRHSSPFPSHYPKRCQRVPSVSPLGPGALFKPHLWEAAPSPCTAQALWGESQGPSQPRKGLPWLQTPGKDP